MNDRERDDYHRRVQTLLAQRAAETRPLTVTPKRAGRVICMTCREAMLDGSGALHAGSCGVCRCHTRGTVAAPPLRPYGDGNTAA